MQMPFGYYFRCLTLIGTIALFTASAVAEERGVLTDKSAPKASSRGLWKWSLVAYGSANALDVWSSLEPHYGREMNSLLSNSNGGFNAGKAVAVKGGVFAATGITEYLLIRRYPRLAKVFSILNFGWSAAETGVAAHNFTLQK
jgi:hypothetical protein